MLDKGNRLASNALVSANESGSKESMASTQCSLPLRTTVVITTLLLTVITASAAGQNTATRPRQPDADKNGATGTPCLFDPDRGEVPNCIHEGKTGGLFVAPQYLKALSFDAHGLAAVNSQKVGWTYVN